MIGEGAVPAAGLFACRIRQTEGYGGDLHSVPASRCVVFREEIRSWPPFIPEYGDLP